MSAQVAGDANVILDASHGQAHLQYLDDTSSHWMQILHDDGLYRHLHFSSVDSDYPWFGRFEVVTWPGSVVIKGDMGTFGFSRIDDMLNFFAGHPKEGPAGEVSFINPRYWSEKAHSRDNIERYSPDKFRESVAAYFNENFDAHHKDHHIVWGDIEDEVLGHANDEGTALEAALRFQSRGFEFYYDAFDGLDCYEYTPQYLWCCFALNDAANAYRAHKSDDFHRFLQGERS